MRHPHLLRLACLVSLSWLPACSASPAPSSSQAEVDPNYPTPYTAEEIHHACKVGRRIEWRVEAAGKATLRRVMTFVTSDDAGADVESKDLAEDGTALAPAETRHATWEELRRHASFPKASVAVHEETTMVPAGTFDCTVYVVKGDDGSVTHFFFAKKHAGPPVFFFTEKDGTRVMTTQLVSDT